MIISPSFLAAASEHSPTVLHSIEGILEQLVFFLKLFIEGLSILIIAFAIVRSIPKLIKNYGRSKRDLYYKPIRLQLGLALALSLEFLLAADILGTALSPSWEGIGILAAITAIRTFINYFLAQEVKELEKETRLESSRI